MTQLARYERKYYLSGRQQKSIESWLQQHPAGFSRLFPTRQVWSLYLDTPNWQLYQDNLVGAMQRYKVRFRWYHSSEFSQPMLEHKAKDGFLVKKKGYALENTTLDSNSPMRLRYRRNDAPALLLHTEPKLCNHYFRSYWLSRDGRIRATVDSDLHFIPVQHRSLSQDTTIVTQSQRHISATILELKYNVQDDNEIDSITRHLPMRMTRSSKYVLGVQSLYGAEAICIPITTK